MGFVTPTLLFAGALAVAVLIVWAAMFVLRVLRRRRRPAPSTPDGGLPWRLPPEPALPAVAADMAQLGDLTLRAASVVGPGHRDQEPARPRQDAYRIGRDSRGEHLILALADGAPPIGRTGLGATLAVTNVVSELRQRLEEGTPLHELTATDIFGGVAQSMVDGAQLRGIPIASVYTTLVTLIVPTRPDRDGSRVAWLGHIGNSSAWLNLGTHWQHLGGDLTSPVPELLPFQPQQAVAALVDLPPRAVVTLATDGMAAAFTGTQGGKLRLATRWHRPPPLLRFLRDVGFEAPSLTDDRTAMVIWCGEPAQ